MLFSIPPINCIFKLFLYYLFLKPEHAIIISNENSVLITCWSFTIHRQLTQLKVDPVKSSNSAHLPVLENQ